MKRLCLLVAVILWAVSLLSCQQMPLKANLFYTDKEMLIVEKSSDAIGLGFGFDSRLDINYFFFKQPVEDEVKQMTFDVPEQSEDDLEAAKKKSYKKKKKKTKLTAEEEKAEKLAAIRESYLTSFASSLSIATDKELYYYYIKVYRLYEMTVYLQSYFKLQKEWRLYNTMRFDYVDAISLYMRCLEHYYKTQKPALYNDLVMQKEEIKLDAILYQQKRYTIVDEYQ